MRLARSPNVGPWRNSWPNSAAPAPGPSLRHRPAAKDKGKGSPTVLVRSAVVTHAHPERFGSAVRRTVAQAHSRGFFQAPHAVFLGDGSAGNWSLQDMYFPGWLPLLDIVHLLEHLYPAAQAACAQDPWPLYLQLLRAGWAGQPAQVLTLLTPHARRVGAPPEDALDTDPRKILANAVTYVRNNQARMDSPRARRRGLPTTTSYVESLINTFNIRIKGAGKFWCPQNVEGVLQVRTACLSTPPRWEDFWKTRAAKHRGRVRPPRRATA